jgi:choline dehydrogenase-like flavoprotein
MGENKDKCATDSFGPVHGLKNLNIADASLLYTAPGVNLRGSVMGFARRNVMKFLGRG